MMGSFARSIGMNIIKKSQGWLSTLLGMCLCFQFFACSVEEKYLGFLCGDNCKKWVLTRTLSELGSKGKWKEVKRKNADTLEFCKDGNLYGYDGQSKISKLFSWKFLFDGRKLIGVDLSDLWDKESTIKFSSLENDSMYILKFTDKLKGKATLSLLRPDNR